MNDPASETRDILDQFAALEENVRRQDNVAQQQEEKEETESVWELFEQNAVKNDGSNLPEKEFERVLVEAEPDYSDWKWQDPLKLGYSVNPIQPRIHREAGTPRRHFQRHMPLFNYVPLQAINPITGLWENYFVMGYLCSSSSYSSSFSSSHSSSSHSSSSTRSSGQSYKQAIVLFKAEWIGWVCSEEPEEVFADSVEVVLCKGEGFSTLPPEFVESVDSHTIKVVSVSPDFPAWMSSMVFQMRDKTLIRVQARKRWVLGKYPTKAVVRVMGRKRNSLMRWQRFSTKTKDLNDRFWSHAWG